MAGLTREGFVPETLENIKVRIRARLETFSPGFDFSIESPDGQLIEIFSFEMWQAWEQLRQVYDSHNPLLAEGAALRNLGLITGIPYGNASRSSANVKLIGTANTLVPAGSIVSNGTYEFITSFAAYTDSYVTVVASLAGPIPVPVGAVDTVVSVVPGWTGIVQEDAGEIGKVARTEQQYRNLRNRTVMRNYTSITDVMVARLSELGVSQVAVLNNDDPTNPLPDGTPTNTIHVTVGETNGVSDADIAKVVEATKGFGCPTHGTTLVVVKDNQGVDHNVRFSKAVEVPVFVDVNVTYLTDDNAGATEGIKADIVAHINALLAGEDVIWSRLFGLVTPYGKAQINSLTIGKNAGSLTASNIAIDPQEYASCTIGSVNVVVV